MDWPQSTMVVSLLISFGASILGWMRFRALSRHHHIMSPAAAAYRRSGWVVAIIPAIEAWVLYMGHFWS